MDGSDEALRRALRYPYEAPGRSYALVDGRPVDPASAATDWSGRERLLAYGANCAPEALIRKLGAAEPLLAERIELDGYDVAYSAHLSLYGAVPGTLVAGEGTAVSAFVLHLTESQRHALDASEPNYELGEAAGMPAYLSRHGLLELDGSPVALAAVPARGRRLPALGQEEVLERVRAQLSPERSLRRFVADAASDPALARRWTEALRPSRSDAG
jgi:hypothetical protein